MVGGVDRHERGGGGQYEGGAGYFDSVGNVARVRNIEFCICVRDRGVGRLVLDIAEEAGLGMENVRCGIDEIQCAGFEVGAREAFRYFVACA